MAKWEVTCSMDVNVLLNNSFPSQTLGRFSTYVHVSVGLTVYCKTNLSVVLMRKYILYCFKITCISFEEMRWADQSFFKKKNNPFGDYSYCLLEIP